MLASAAVFIVNIYLDFFVKIYKKYGSILATVQIWSI